MRACHRYGVSRHYTERQQLQQAEGAGRVTDPFAWDYSSGSESSTLSALVSIEAVDESEATGVESRTSWVISLPDPFQLSISCSNCCANWARSTDTESVSCVRPVTLARATAAF